MATLRASLGLLSLFFAAGCGDEPSTETTQPSVGAQVYNEWVQVELPDTVCGNGTQYKFYVNWWEGAKNLAVVFEGGGACWDYDSCTGNAGIRGAANPDGIADNHMVIMQHVFPFTRRTDPENPIHDWNLVYLPYCTGDIHSGNRVVPYDDPAGLEASIEFHHAGHPNVEAIVPWLAKQMPHIPRMMVTGCSAGGAGSIANYYFLRSGLSVERGYLLDDSGPIFPSTGGYSGPLHQAIRDSWNIDSLFGKVPISIDTTDLGSINLALADQFPKDRLAVTYFMRDYNYSLYSYERFYPDVTKDEIHAMWAADTKLMANMYDSRDNLAYFIPYWRDRNSSHCSTLFDFAGTEIQEAGVDLGDFVNVLLDDSKPLESYIESPQSGEDGTP